MSNHAALTPASSALSCGYRARFGGSRPRYFLPQAFRSSRNAAFPPNNIIDTSEKGPVYANAKKTRFLTNSRSKFLKNFSWKNGPISAGTALQIRWIFQRDDFLE